MKFYKKTSSKQKSLTVKTAKIKINTEIPVYRCILISAKLLTAIFFFQGLTAIIKRFMSFFHSK